MSCAHDPKNFADVAVGAGRASVGLPRCLIPGFDGAIFSTDWKDAL